MTRPYGGYSKEDLMDLQDTLRDQLKFHSHADRMESRETDRQKECEWKLKHIREEWKIRAELGREVLKKLDILKDRWTPNHEGER